MSENISYNKTTEELENNLEEKQDLAAFLAENRDEFVSADIPELIGEMLRKKNMSKAALSKRSGMSNIYLYQILSGKRLPSRDRMLCICLGLECTLEETQELLKQSRYAPLYAKVRRDAMIIYAINNKWGVERLNDMLYESEENTLC